MAMLNNQRVLWIGIKGMINHQPWDCVNMEKTGYGRTMNGIHQSKGILTL